MPDFQVVSKYSPAGDQPEAIASLAQGLRESLDLEKLYELIGLSPDGPAGGTTEY